MGKISFQLLSLQFMRPKKFCLRKVFKCGLRSIMRSPTCLQNNKESCMFEIFVDKIKECFLQGDIWRAGWAVVLKKLPVWIVKEEALKCTKLQREALEKTEGGLRQMNSSRTCVESQKIRTLRGHYKKNIINYITMNSSNFKVEKSLLVDSHIFKLSQKWTCVLNTFALIAVFR